MKLVRFGEAGHEKPGLIDAEHVLRDLSGEIADFDGPNLSKVSLTKIGGWDPKSFPKADPSHRLGPPVGRVGNFYAVGRNYAEHAAETGSKVPTEPMLFNKATSCIVGPRDDIVVPLGSTKLDWEVEVAIVMAETAHYISEDLVLDHVAGFCLCNDVSERAFQKDRGGQYVKGKSAPTFGPLGPWLVTPDELGDLAAIDLWLDVNGERRQTGTTADMVFSIRAIVSHVSQFLRLMPGDVITTGTPAGVAAGMKPPLWLKPGDVVTLGGKGLGEQRQVVKTHSA